MSIVGLRKVQRRLKVKPIVVFCNDDTCIHNQNGSVCGNRMLTLEKEFGEFEKGKHKVYVACQDYRSKEDADNRESDG